MVVTITADTVRSDASRLDSFEELTIDPSRRLGMYFPTEPGNNGQWARTYNPGHAGGRDRVSRSPDETIGFELSFPDVGLIQ
ncbi:hypothetical protein CLCR_01773 [Cladophialophora carrionii]|uniref:Uncharacterized protein n=1 Tax=Cladophialophora carrionii TaxID=86049 RepID=A0A1C1CB97_9EURO|nr:hypothetical protein CLCR_01773 [Cladophialophora carrionii]